MLEDKLLVWKLKRGSSDALQRIYEKYKDDLLALAVSLSNDKSAAEDALHDVFVSFVRYADRLRLRTSLKSYLLSCIANRVRDMNRAGLRGTVELEQAQAVGSNCDRPEQAAISTELFGHIDKALAQLPYQQREVIILHLQGGMKFNTIAEYQRVSINTIQSRYRYGLDKLRSILNGKVQQ
jgi:RNA polymerase sigma-70 factor (ECF subfamily)